MTTSGTISQQLPNDIILNIFEYPNTKLKLISAFPWLSEFVPMCEFCKCRDSCFIIKFEYDTIRYKDCSRDWDYDEYCNCVDPIHNVEYTYNKFKYICKLDCHMLSGFDDYGSYSLYDSNINKNYDMNAIYKIKYECQICYKYKLYHIDASGMQIQTLPTTRKIIQRFIKNNLIKINSQKIHKSTMVKYYKQFSPTDLKFAEIRSIFDIELENDNDYYLNYQFKDEETWLIIIKISDF